MPLPRKPLLVLAACVGVLAGLGGATAHKAKAFSYLSSEPEVCTNCHIMQPQYESWQKSSHHAVAECVDCHLPHGFVGKWTMKAINGWHHSAAFTVGGFQEPIMIKSTNARILQENCVRCHDPLVHDQFATRDARSGQELQCTHCHDRVGHGDTFNIGGPMRPDELAGAAPPAGGATAGATGH